MKTIRTAIALAMLGSPMLGVIVYLPFAEMAYGSIDALKGLIYGPLVILPLGGIGLFLTSKHPYSERVQNERGGESAQPLEGEHHG